MLEASTTMIKEITEELIEEFERLSIAKRVIQILGENTPFVYAEGANKISKRPYCTYPLGLDDYRQYESEEEYDDDQLPCEQRQYNSSYLKDIFLCKESTLGLEIATVIKMLDPKLTKKVNCVDIDQPDDSFLEFEEKYVKDYGYDFECEQDTRGAQIIQDDTYLAIIFNFEKHMTMYLCDKQRARRLAYWKALNLQ